MQEVFKKITDELNKFIDSRDARINTNQNYNGSGGFSKAIEIVNQVASEVGEEVCEWRGNSDLRNHYNVGCDEIMIIPKIHTTTYKHCPYCGKRIKVVE